MMFVGWTPRVAGTVVAVSAVAAVGVAPDGRVVAVGALPCVVVTVSVACAPDMDCDDELEFTAASRCWRKTAKSAAASAAAGTASVPMRGTPPEEVCGVGGSCGVGQGVGPCSAVPAGGDTANPTATRDGSTIGDDCEGETSQTLPRSAASASGVKRAPQAPQ
jgi:hypothetical protein